jgi:hypothetical protein
MLRYLTRPISDHTWQRPARTRERSRFTATWTNTLDLLDREYTALRGRELVIEVDVPETKIRNDGMLRADATASSPAVVIAFESKHGPLLYRCDVYGDRPWSREGAPHVWQHNVRAIALTLEALRAVDRYGASASGEQYRGYKAIESNAMALPSAMTVEQAIELVGRFSKVAWTAMPLSAVARRAQRNTHPDHDGNAADFQRVQAAIDVLRREGRL